MRTNEYKSPTPPLVTSSFGPLLGQFKPRLAAHAVVHGIRRIDDEDHMVQA